MTVGRYQARPIALPSGGRSWTVCDSRGIPVLDADDYLQSLRARPASVNTLKSYSEHLAALLTYLAATGTTWEEVGFHDLTEFMIAYRDGTHPVPKRGTGPRGPSTLRSAAAALRGFYEYHREETGRGPENLRLSKMVRHGSRGGQSRRFLAHIEARRESSEANRLSHGMPMPDQSIQIINFEDDFQRLLDACRSLRDQVMLSGFYDLGLRIGGMTGLKHGDLDVRRHEVTVTRREDNPNGALSKRRGSFVVHAGQSRFFDLYRDYLLNEVVYRGIESDFVLVNLRHRTGEPLSYSNAFQQVQAIGIRAGVGAINPHMLRHTHATALAKAGWTSAEIAARLGQKSAASADVYIHLANEDIERRLRATEHLIWPGIASPRTEP